MERTGNSDISGDTALDRINQPKRRRRTDEVRTLPAHSKPAARFAGLFRFATRSWGSASLHPRLYAVTRSAGSFESAVVN